MCFTLLCLLELLNWLLSERRRAGACGEEGEGKRAEREGEKAKEAKGNRDREEDMNRGISLSQMEGSTPGLLPYEGKVLCDEAESYCPTACTSGTRLEKNRQLLIVHIP